MKEPRAKIHLMDVAEPLLAFHQLVMRCETVLQNAEPEFFVTEELCEEGSFMMPFRTCRACLERPPEKSEKRRYVYGLIEGQSVRNAEDAA